MPDKFYYDLIEEQMKLHSGSKYFHAPASMRLLEKYSAALEFCEIYERLDGLKIFVWLIIISLLGMSYRWNSISELAAEIIIVAGLILVGIAIFYSGKRAAFLKLYEIREDARSSGFSLHRKTDSNKKNGEPMLLQVYIRSL